MLNPAEHTYTNPAFEELVQDAVRFFGDTPPQPLPPTQSFTGTGVYALYYKGDFELYKTYQSLNHPTCQIPIYVGKAVPAGWRQSRQSTSADTSSTELLRRLTEHSRSIQAVSGLSVEDFECRFAIFDGPSADMIGTVEAALIRLYQPLWNSVLDGFGNHDPGKGRYEQARSDWDVVHPGRPWAQKCKGIPNDHASIEAAVRAHLDSIGRQP